MPTSFGLGVDCLHLHKMESCLLFDACGETAREASAVRGKRVAGTLGQRETNITKEEVGAV
jgi:hypothetical protein